MPDEVYLRRQREMHLVTRGRRTGRSHRVELWFASGPGRIYLMAYARRHGRGTDWYQNLASPTCLRENTAGRWSTRTTRTRSAFRSA